MISTRARIGLGVAAVVGVGVAAWQIDKSMIASARNAARRRAEAEAKRIQEAELKCLHDTYFKKGAQLADQILNGLAYARKYVEPVAVNLNTKAQISVFESALKYAERGDTGDGADMDDVIMRLLRQALPECAWANQAWPATKGSDWALAYNGLSELLQLAILEMRYGEFKSLAAGGGTGVVCPGWRHESPAPMTGAKPNDYVEIVVGTEKSNGEPVLEERIHAVIIGVHGDTVHLLILEPGETLPNGQKTTGPQYADQHGYYPGVELSIPKRCIFKLIKK